MKYSDSKNAHMKTMVCLSLLTLHPPKVTARDKSTIDISDIRLEKEDDLVRLSFDIIIRNHSENEYKIITPEIKGKSGSKDFSPIGITNNYAQLLSLRHKQRNESKQPFIHSNGTSFTYTDSILYEDWMDGGKLIMNYTDSTCCRIETVNAKVT